MIPLLETFAQNLKIVRKGKGLTQTELAERLGVTKQSVINYEKGNSFPAGNRLRKLTEALEVDAELLFGKDFFKREEQHNLEIAYDKKAEFCYQLSEAEEYQERDMLLDFLSTCETGELYNAVMGIFDEQIAQAGKEYEKIVISGKSRTTGGLNGDIYIDKKAYEIDE